MQRQDEDYKQVIAKLNGAFAQKQEGQTVNPGVFEKMDSEKQKLIEELPYEEIRKIGARVHSNITDIGFLTKQEKELLGEIKEGRKNKYKQVIYRLVGDVDVDLIMKRYSYFIKSEPVFRTLYLYKGLQEPVRVVCEERDSVFPIRDARGLTAEKQNFLLKNVLAAEMRREFDIETDPILRMQGYLTGQQGMLVVISIYPYAAYSTGIRAMLYKIFEGMIPKMSDLPVIDEKEVAKLNEKLRAESVAYWKKLMLPVGRSLTIPGERRPEPGVKGHGKTFLYKELGAELTGELREFCDKNKVSLGAVFLYAWGNLMGRYHDEKNPMLLVAQRGEKMNLFPVKFSRDMKNSELGKIDRQLEESAHFGKCSGQDIEKETGISFSEYFRMAHEFMEFREVDLLGEGANMEVVSGVSPEDTDVNLFISYQMYDRNISVNYISKGGLTDLVLENLHELFTEELSRLLLPEQEKFDKATFITADDKGEERVYKLKLAQIALFLKESGIFEAVTVEEIMKLAEYCELKTFLMNDTIVTEKSTPGAVCIVGDGRVEETLISFDGMVQSLRIHEKGAIFGLECLFDGGQAGTSFTVISSKAQVVLIQPKVLTEAFRRKPEGWISLLSREIEQKLKFQKLWSME